VSQSIYIYFLELVSDHFRKLQNLYMSSLPLALKGEKKE